MYQVFVSGMLLPTSVITDVDTSAITLWRERNATELTSQNEILRWLRSTSVPQKLPKILVTDYETELKSTTPVGIMDDLSGMWWGDVESDSESDVESESDVDNI